MSLTKADIATVRSAFDATSGPLGLAVSGGGDSLAMAALASDWAVSVERPLFAVTVDHGLRPESASEAQSVGAFCREFGIAHDVVVWDEWAGRGNLQDAARQARKRLIGAWAKANGISHVATGHTLDDQAETVLLRLARGSGVDGLAAMAPQRVEARLTWHRPLLGARRTALRDYLSVNGIPWIDDPSNEDTRFDRVRVRQALAVLAPLGIEPEGLVATAARMARARHGLEVAASDLAKAALRIDQCDVVLDWPKVASAPEELRLRLVAHCLRWISSAPYRPRAKALEDAIAAMSAGRATVLSGCLITAQGSLRRMTREYQAVKDLETGANEIWDGRWQFRGRGDGMIIRALGEEGLRACPDWRDGGLPRTSALATPGVWEGGRLVAAPFVGFPNGWRAEPLHPPESFPASIISD